MSPTGPNPTGTATPPSMDDSLDWAGDGAAHLRGLMTRMGEEAFTRPSLLPGWTRAHVLTHIARNADAMVNLLKWAKTGTETPAYVSREQRDADIEAGSHRTPDEIRADVIASSDRLADAVRVMPKDKWKALVRGPQGTELPVYGVIWGRAREVWIHAVDLDVGASFEDMPVPMLAVLIDDVGARLGTLPGCPEMTLEDSDSGRSVHVGPGPDGPDGPARDLGTVRGPGHELAAWLLGRSKGKALRTSDGARPGPLPSWL